jgi:hypothetical protein
VGWGGMTSLATASMSAAGYLKVSFYLQLNPLPLPAAPHCHPRSFAWGPAAAALQQAASGGAAASADQQQQQQQQQQRALLQQRLPLEPARAALTVCHWPEACTLSAPGSGFASSPASQPAGSGGGLPQLPAVAAAYDPGFLLPFCCACLQRQLLSPRAFAEAGLLSGRAAGLWAVPAGRCLIRPVCLPLLLSGLLLLFPNCLLSLTSPWPSPLPSLLASPLHFCPSCLPLLLSLPAGTGCRRHRLPCRRLPSPGPV